MVMKKIEEAIEEILKLADDIQKTLN